MINYSNAKKTLDYIKNNTLYEVGLIKKHINRLDNYNQVKPFGFKKLYEFCNSFSKIYIYGYGRYGHEIKRYMDDVKLQVEKFVVTKQEYNAGDVMTIDELVVDENTGIILAVGAKNTKQVKELLYTLIPLRQVFIPQY